MHISEAFIGNNSQQWLMHILILNIPNGITLIIHKFISTEIDNYANFNRRESDTSFWLHSCLVMKNFGQI